MNSTLSTIWAGWPSDSANRYKVTRMYLFSYAASNEEANELYAETTWADWPLDSANRYKAALLSGYLFSSSVFNEEDNEFYAEYHLGRLAFRLCKQVQRSALFTSSATRHPTRRPMNSTRSTTWAGWPLDSANRYKAALLSGYLFSSSISNEEDNELYAEYNLGRLAFRLCKQVQRRALLPL
jgi:hypothetical protein